MKIKIFVFNDPDYFKRQLLFIGKIGNVAL